MNMKNIRSIWHLFSTFLTDMGYDPIKTPDFEEMRCNEVAEGTELVVLLSKLIEQLKSLSQKIEEKTTTAADIVKSQEEQNVKSVNKETTQSNSVKSCERSVDKSASFNPELVQIRASKSEIDRRISAFINRKQEEVDEANRREFCNIIKPDPDGSCARTDSMFVASMGSKSHVKVSRVFNKFGPQTRQPTSPDFSQVKRQRLMPVNDTDDSSSAPSSRSGGEPHRTDTETLTGVEERLSSMETHMNLKKGGVPGDVYSRLKALENRLLFLESVSPEYFQQAVYQGKAMVKTEHKHSHQPRATSTPQLRHGLGDIECRMKLLKQSLLEKQRKMTGETADPTTS